MARSTLGVCSERFCTNPAGAPAARRSIPFENASSSSGVAQAHEEQRARHQLVAVAFGERRCQPHRRREVGADRRELGRRRLHPHDAEGDVGTVGELVDRAAHRSRGTGQPGAEVAEERRRRGREARARTNWSRMVLPGCRPSRSASTKLTVASSSARGSAARPSVMCARSSTVPKRRSAGSIGNRSTGPTRRPSPVRPVNTRLTLAARRGPDLREPFDVVEVDGTGEAEGAATGDDGVAGPHGPAELPVGVWSSAPHRRAGPGPRRRRCRR